MPAQLTDSQFRAIEYTSRTASLISLIGTIFIFVTFLTQPAFRKPFNRLVFYAALGNTLFNAATMISRNGILAGSDSRLCQFQGFLVQMFLPADALWNLAMAINVYMSLFRRYNVKQLKSLEWRYFVACYGVTFIIAFTYLFIDTQSKGRIYGPATLWCWISIEYDYLRIALVYGPAWICILVSLSIYILAGREIYRKRRELLNYSRSPNFALPLAKVENPFTSFKTTEFSVTSELAVLSPATNVSRDSLIRPLNQDDQVLQVPRGYDQYSVSVETKPMNPRVQSTNPRSVRSSTQRLESMQEWRNIATVEANTATWTYTKCALFFFVSLLITWIPSSLNRVYSLIYPDRVSFPFSYASSLVLPLMGFWNTVIYIGTSWAACRTLYQTFLNRRQKHALLPLGSSPQSKHFASRNSKRGRGSFSSSMRGLDGF
ncbi:hypothetical protein MMC12_008209 [Toensbergia leucococca]|nr:hypothetical protein [Toensbergia leucococca]